MRFCSYILRCSWCACDPHQFPRLDHQVQVKISKSLWRPTHTKTLEVTSVSRSYSQDPAFKDKHRVKSFFSLPLSCLWSLCIWSQALWKSNGGMTVQVILHLHLNNKSLHDFSMSPLHSGRKKKLGFRNFLFLVYFLSILSPHINKFLELSAFLNYRLKIIEQTWNRMIKCTPDIIWVLQKICCLSRIG